MQFGVYRGRSMIRMTTKRKAGRIVYQATSFRKAIYALFLAFFLWGMVVTMGDPEATGSFAVPIACSLFCLFGLLYREGWVFDPQKKTVVSLFGFGPFVKKKVFPYEEIKGLAITHFVKGDTKADAKPSRKRHKKAMVVFSLVTKDDESHTIEIIPERTSLGRTERAAQAIGAVSGLALDVDRPFDQDLHVSFRD